MNIYMWIIIGCWFVFVAYWLKSAMSAKANVHSRAAWTGFIVRLVIIAGVVWWLSSPAVQNLPVSQAGTVNPVLGFIGALCGVVGIGFAVWARQHLGRNWGMPMSVKKDPELVTSGPYTYVRHPIYTGVLLALIGSVLLADSFWLVIAPVMVVYFIYSATKEEALMTKEFPDVYPEYKQRTKMLIPFVF